LSGGRDNLSNLPGTDKKKTLEFPFEASWGKNMKRKKEIRTNHPYLGQGERKMLENSQKRLSNEERKGGICEGG